MKFEDLRRGVEGAVREYDGDRTFSLGSRKLGDVECLIDCNPAFPENPFLTFAVIKTSAEDEEVQGVVDSLGGAYLDEFSELDAEKRDSAAELVNFAWRLRPEELREDERSTFAELLEALAEGRR